MLKAPYRPGRTKEQIRAETISWCQEVFAPAKPETQASHEARGLCEHVTGDYYGAEDFAEILVAAGFQRKMVNGELHPRIILVKYKDPNYWYKAHGQMTQNKDGSWSHRRH